MGKRRRPSSRKRRRRPVSALVRWKCSQSAYAGAIPRDLSALPYYAPQEAQC